MEPQEKLQLMDQLFTEIEQGWRRDRDRAIVYRLAEQHPALREELYEFFEALVLGDTGDVSSEIGEAEESIARWIQSSGIDLAIAAAKNERLRTRTTQPDATTSQEFAQSDLEQGARRESEQVSASDDTWVTFLRRRIGQGLPDVASALSHVNVEYLVLVSRHPDVVPNGVRKTLATLVEDRWRVPVQESMQYLSGRRRVVRAASRSRPFGREPSNFDELLDRSALTSEQKTFWLQHASMEQCDS